MLKNLKLWVILPLLFITIGLMFYFNREKKSINDPSNNHTQKEMEQENEYISIDESYEDGDASIDREDKYASIDNNINVAHANDQDKESPDTKYYKKARLLEKAFPGSFIMNSSSDRKVVALTFDDGPDTKTTPQILNILNEYNTPATFFIVGQNGKKYPNILQRMVDEGHQIGNHSWSHLRPTELDYRDFTSELFSTQDLLKGYVGSTKPFYYRPPYGIADPHQIEQMSNDGYLVISWSLDSLDWNTTNSKEILDKVINSIHPGAIVLMHSTGGPDNRLATIKALPEIIENLSAQGYEFLTVEDLINNK